MVAIIFGISLNILGTLRLRPGAASQQSLGSGHGPPLMARHKKYHQYKMKYIIIGILLIDINMI